MGTEITEVNEISSYSGKCHVEMTREQAKEQGHSIFREFKHLDTDKDGELSFEEIMDSREKKTQKKRISAGIFSLAAGIFAFDGLKTELFRDTCRKLFIENITAKGISLSNELAGMCFEISRAVTFGITLMVAGIAIYKKFKSDRMKTENEVLKKQFKNLQAA